MLAMQFFLYFLEKKDMLRVLILKTTVPPTFNLDR